MDYEREDKAALCRATLAIAKDEARGAGATEAGTLAGRIPLEELLSEGIPWAKDGWSFVPGDPFGKEDGRKGAIVERGGSVAAAFPVY